ncbi:MAG: 23S rRNA (adenine(2503)-C(2))-methyltransferase RlmN [Planctomycetota bacterium]
MSEERPHFFDHTPESLGELFQGWGLPRYRAKQVMDWVYAKGIVDPAKMTNLGQTDRELLSTQMRFLDGAVVQHQRATDGTQKLLVDWSLESDAPGYPPDNPLNVLGSLPGDSTTQTECVMIPSDHDSSGRKRRTACISSQVGCPVGCKFCASGLGGLDGNLTTGQIVQQAWQLNHMLSTQGSGVDSGGRLTNVVFMGMGEPMANLRHVLPAVRTLAADWGMGLSARKITVSTVGVPAGIRKLADLDLPVTLAISLHAPNDHIRQQIIPWAEFVSIEQLTDAGRDYFNKTGREITLEYILLGGLNDQPDHAHELVGVTRKLRSNINLIRYNEVAGLPFARPADRDVHTFQNILQQSGVNTHIRASRGRDIAAACGQLRHESASNSNS